jgi:hypothetical protein
MPGDGHDDGLPGFDDLGHEVAEAFEVFLELKPYEGFIFDDENGLF